MTVTIENTYTGNNSSTDYSFTFPYLDTTDIKASLDGVLTTAYSLLNATTVRFTSAPGTGVAIRIYRDTAYTNPKATFYAGSVIRAGDLNDNTLQNLYVTQEANTKINDAWLTGDPTVISTEAWYTTDDTKIASTKAIEGRIDAKMSGIAVNNLADGSARQVLQTAANGNDVEWTDNIDLPGSLDVTGAATFDSTVTATTFTGNLTGNAGTATDLAAAAKITNSEQAAHSVNDTTYFTTSASDARYFNVTTGDTIKDGDTFPDNDTTIATTAAINDRIIDLVDDVGGFVPIANETSFPNSNPDINGGAGTLISIQALSQNLTSSGSGEITIANGTVGNATVTIVGAANSTTYAATFGMIVETHADSNKYTFHRLVPKATEVTTVAGSISNINTVAGNMSAINTVNSISSAINTVNSNSTNINAVAGEILFSEDLGLITASLTTGSGNDINTVANAITNINTVAGIDANITTVAGISSNVTSVAGNATNINAVAGNATNINAVAGNSSNINSAAGNATNINSVVSNATNINTVAGSIADVNRYATEYAISSSTPGSPTEGDLWYDSTNNVLKYYNSSAFVGITPGLTDVLNDASPELGGHLDCNDKNLTEVGTVSGDNLQIDFGTLS